MVQEEALEYRVPTPQFLKTLSALDSCYVILYKQNKYTWTSPRLASVTNGYVSFLTTRKKTSDYLTGQCVLNL